MERNNFVSQSSYLAWKCFKETGSLGFYMLYSHIENPPKELVYNPRQDHEMER